MPVNFDGFNRGTVTIRQALTQSLNIPAVLALDAVGPARLLARLRRAECRRRSCPTIRRLALPSGLAALA